MSVFRLRMANSFPSSDRPDAEKPPYSVFLFLDDVTLSELEETLQVKIDIVKSSGQDFIEAIIKEK